MNQITRRRLGFSLLEVMLAIAMSAILMGLIAAAMQLYSDMVMERNQTVTNAHLGRAVLQQIATDLRGAIYEEPSDDSGSIAPDDGSSAGEDAAGAGAGADTSTADDTATDDGGAEDLTTEAVSSVPGIYGTATELRLDVRGNFTHPLRYDAIVEAGGDPLLENLLSVDQVVTYYLRSASASELAGTPLEMPGGALNDQSLILVRRVQKRAEAEFESSIGGESFGGAEQLLSDRVVAIEFAYHDGYDWTDSWDSELDGGLPLAVQVTVTVADPNDTDSEITMDNIFQIRVALPTAEAVDDSTLTGGI